MSNNLFEEFEGVSSKQWKQKIQFDLKGADYQETLISKTPEGVLIKPFYHRDEYKSVGKSKTSQSFKIAQKFRFDSVEKLEEQVREALQKGVEGLALEPVNPFEFHKFMQTLEVDFDLSKIDFHFDLNYFDRVFIQEIQNRLDPKQIFFGVDLIGNLAKNGNWYFSQIQDHEILKEIICKDKIEKNLFLIDVRIYENAGANKIQQIAYALAHANEYANYLVELKEGGFIDQAQFKSLLSSFQFKFSVGSDYFLEIAKLQSFRYLWSLILSEYGVEPNGDLFTEPSVRNKTLYDANVNLLRTSTELMSAILGGSNTVCSLEYDSFFKEEHAFSQRISRNQLLLIREESYLNNDRFFEGTYYLEALKTEFSQKALELFKEIEKSGGFLKQLKKGTIQKKIKESHDKQIEAFKTEELKVLGSNKYPDPQEFVQEKVERHPFLIKKSRETAVVPIVPKRITEAYEQMRLRNEVSKS